MPFTLPALCPSWTLSLSSLSLSPGCAKCQLFFSAFPSTEGAWEDTLHFLFNAIIIESIQQNLNL